MEIEALRGNLLFRGMDEDEIRDCLRALSARTKGYKKDALILRAGEKADRMGVVLQGSVTVETNDVWGSCTILSHVGAGGFFAETYAYLQDAVMLVDVAANADCEVLFLRIGELQNAPADCGWRAKLISNLLSVSMHKNLTLAGRSFHTAPKSIRGRVLAYLNTLSIQKQSTEFDIPFDRQQLADYLNVERTALSKELGRMQAEGLIRVRRNHFVLLRASEASGNGHPFSHF